MILHYTMPSDIDERYHAEIELLKAMYPGQLQERDRELNFTSIQFQLQLRLPCQYLVDALPEVIIASIGRQDTRDEMSKILLSCPKGEEILDAIILAFSEMAASIFPHKDLEEIHHQTPNETHATVIIWLHHLLNTDKRKQCLSPAASVSGVTKPGHPGVLIYSGSSEAVYEHVDDLKQLHWAAFQVRLEVEVEWKFKHGNGMIEVESLKDVAIEVGEHNKENFLESMRMR